MPTYQRAILARSSRSLQDLDRTVDGLWNAEMEWKTRRKDAVLASPVFWQPDRISPVSSKIGTNRMHWTQGADGGGFIHAQRDWLNRYDQVCRTPIEPGLGPFFELVRTNEFRFDVDPYRDFGTFASCDMRSIREYSQNLLTELTNEGKLDAAILKRLDPASRYASVDDHEAIAKAFREHIANSGEFSYDAKTRPAVKDRDRDPIEDFLLTHKTGTCEQFATALILMMRSVGIPARIVIGFRGCELDDDGRYIIRQEMAHAWCEVLIRRKIPDDYFTSTNPKPKFVFAFLNIDPTPGDGGGTENTTTLADSVQSYWQRLGDWFTSFISKYDPEQREKLWRNTVSAFKRWWPIVLELLAVGIVCFGIFRILKRARLNRKAPPVRSTSSTPEWYLNFLNVAQSRGVAKLPSETPLEHSRRLAKTLPDQLAQHPLLIAETVSAIQYGGQTHDPHRMIELVRELQM
jgi:protein-glutamine gamma-glutamyltransferase